jgi:hypothetical protein
MSRTVVRAVVVAAVVSTGVIFTACGDGDEGRKASIGATGQKPDTPPGKAVSAEQRPDRGQSPDPPPGAAKALAAMQRRIAREAEREGNDATYASYVDATTGEIVLITDASEEEIAKVKNDTDPANKKELDKAKVKKDTKTEDVWHRRDDIPAFWGGGGIAAGGGICSAGYAARTSGGAIVSVTAGHCWANGTAVTTESGGQSYGTVSNRRLPTSTGHAMDVELVGGRSYAGRIFTGGITSTTSIPVVAAGSALAGYGNYCHSGRTTGQSCGHTATSTSGQVCTQTGCKSPVIVFTGGNMIQPGDSGGTFYAADASGAWIRGNTIASGGGTGYAQPWTVIAPHLGLTIVTG